MSDPARLDAVAMSERLRAGTLSVEDIARSCLGRIAARDGEVRAWTHIDADLVLAEARERDKQGWSGPLHGLPIGIKDVFLTRDMPTQYNSPIYRGFAPRMDAAAVALLRQAGALIFGKTDTVEFAATGRKALTRNPHDLAHTPGGSSSGSAAAVADFHVPLALGTQTGGSMIRPASFCGVHAIKPSWGLVSTEGARRFSTTLDTVGWFARSARDMALLYDVLDPERAPTDAPFAPEGSRLGFCRTPYWDRADASTRAAFSSARAAAVRAGGIIEDVELPAEFAALAAVHVQIMRGEGRSAFLPEYRRAPDLLHADIRAIAENGDGTTRAQLREAYDIAASCRTAFDAFASAFDAIIAPSTVGEATVGLETTGDVIFCGFWTLLHVPCLNMPGWVGETGLPVGLTLTGPRFSDRRLLAVVQALEPVFAP